MSKSVSRIMITGRPGSGKSTCAHALAQKLNLPLHHLDKHFFIADWAKRDYDDFLAIQQTLVDQDKWIIDGCSLKSLEMRYARADVCLYFIYPRWLCLYRLIKRIFIKNPDIKDRAPGCSESISWELITYMWTFEYRQNNRVIHLIEELRVKYPHVIFYAVHNDHELKEIMEKLVK